MRPRQERSEARRLSLLDACIRLIGKGGIAAATHRAIATEAGAPLGATTYYFASRQELVREALEHAIARASARLGPLAGALAGVETVADLADVLGDEQARWFAGDRDGMLAAYEIYLEAARRPELQPAVARWTEAYVEVLAPALARLGAPAPRRAARRVVAVVDGLVLDHLTRPAADVRTSLAADLGDVLAGLVPR